MQTVVLGHQDDLAPASFSVSKEKRKMAMPNRWTRSEAIVLRKVVVLCPRCKKEVEGTEQSCNERLWYVTNAHMCRGYFGDCLGKLAGEYLIEYQI